MAQNFLKSCVNTYAKIILTIYIPNSLIILAIYFSHLQSTSKVACAGKADKTITLNNTNICIKVNPNN